MDTKLTLKLDGDIIEQAKSYAKEKNTSLSKLIEAYLGLLTDPNSDHEFTPLVKSLLGVFRANRSTDYKKDYKKYIVNKYST
ncbi:MAG: DUF6364 family protein [Flavobacteriales bacterium]|nr:DUF6364 family protein [Flavobacteriales bacterium]